MSQEKRSSFRVKCFARKDVSKETLGTQCVSQVQRLARKEVSSFAGTSRLADRLPKVTWVGEGRAGLAQVLLNVLMAGADAGARDTCADEKALAAAILPL
eukprot:771302-Pyramimonas_sp.AAC.1